MRIAVTAALASAAFAAYAGTRPESRDDSVRLAAYTQSDNTADTFEDAPFGVDAMVTGLFRRRSRRSVSLRLRHGRVAEHPERLLSGPVCQVIFLQTRLRDRA